MKIKITIETVFEVETYEDLSEISECVDEAVNRLSALAKTTTRLSHEGK